LTTDINVLFNQSKPINTVKTHHKEKIMSQPFARAQAIFALIAAAMATANPTAAMAGVPLYVSRGKGRGARQASSRCVAHDQRDAVKSRNQLRQRRAVR
jgi:hypothetical protein